MSLSKGICQQNTNHCFDSVELKKISYIIFERDYLKSLTEEQANENDILLNKINNLSFIDSLRIKNIESKDSIGSEKDKVISSEKIKNKKLEKDVKKNKLAIKIISLLALVLIILK